MSGRQAALHAATVDFQILAPVCSLPSDVHAHQASNLNFEIFECFHVKPKDRVPTARICSGTSFAKVKDLPPRTLP